MKLATHHVYGQLIERNGRYALLLTDPQPDLPSDASLYLRYALITAGREEPIFPAELLDDWGTPIKGLKIYRWIRQFGNEFPRAEVFGTDRRGKETQCFLRDIEIYFKLPCYAYVNKQQAISEGVKIEAILLPTAVSSPQKIDKPTTWPAPKQGKGPKYWQRPLKSSAVRWWLVPPDMDDFPFLFTDNPITSG